MPPLLTYRINGRLRGVVCWSRAVSTTLSYACPSCAATVHVTAAALGRPLRCPECGISFTINRPSVAVSSPSLQNPPSPPPPPPRRIPRPRALDDIEKAEDIPVFPALEPKPPPLPDEDLPEAIDLKLPAPTDRSRSASIPSGPSLGVPLRYVRWLVFWAIWGGPLVLLALFVPLSAASGDGELVCSSIGSLICLGGPWLLAGGWIARWTSPLVMAGIFRTARCPGCQENISLTSRWNCGCGYKDHRERHAYLTICPLCGKRSGHFDCPRCDATILL